MPHFTFRSKLGTKRPTCGLGRHWVEALKQCVPDCPEGKGWSVQFQTCMRCSQPVDHSYTNHFDEGIQMCVAHDCPPEQFWDQGSRRCRPMSDLGDDVASLPLGVRLLAWAMGYR